MGRSVTLDGQRFTVIGVMPPEFRFPLDEEPADVWAGAGNLYRFDRQWRGYRAYRSIARLAPGMELGRARAEVGLIARRLSQLYPKESAGRTITLAPYDRAVRTGRAAFLIVLAAVGVVLLVACANIANLQLVRASARRRELAIRAALGAGRGPIIRQFLTESLLLAAIAGALGLAAAVAGSICCWRCCRKCPAGVRGSFRRAGAAVHAGSSAWDGAGGGPGAGAAGDAYEPAGHLEGRGTGNGGRHGSVGAHCWWRRSAWRWCCWPDRVCWFAASPG